MDLNPQVPPGLDPHWGQANTRVSGIMGGGRTEYESVGRREGAAVIPEEHEAAGGTEHPAPRIGGPGLRNLRRVTDAVESVSHVGVPPSPGTRSLPVSLQSAAFMIRAGSREFKETGP